MFVCRYKPTSNSFISKKVYSELYTRGYMQNVIFSVEQCKTSRGLLEIDLFLGGGVVVFKKCLTVKVRKFKRVIYFFDSDIRFLRHVKNKQATILTVHFSFLYSSFKPRIQVKWELPLTSWTVVERPRPHRRGRQWQEELHQTDRELALCVKPSSLLWSPAETALINLPSIYRY